MNAGATNEPSSTHAQVLACFTFERQGDRFELRRGRHGLNGSGERIYRAGSVRQSSPIEHCRCRCFAGCDHFQMLRRPLLFGNLCDNGPDNCHSEPFAVIPSKARNLALSALGKLREESRPENRGTARFLLRLRSGPPSAPRNDSKVKLSPRRPRTAVPTRNRGAREAPFRFTRRRTPNSGRARR